ncbi:MAG: M48 family metallopeptidase [bacterium]|nr:M48 family metallopeptidase [bacterium]
MRKSVIKTEPLEFEGIPAEVVYRRVKYSRVEFKGGGLRVIVPRGIDPMKVLEDNREAILRKHRRLQDQIRTAREMPMVEWTVERFGGIVDHYMVVYSRQLGVEAKLVKFRKMRRRWGSCRNDGMITLNIYLQFVPEHLIAYIVYHELAHLIIRGHNKEFKRIISNEFPNYRQLDKELNLYGLKLLS